MPFSIASNQITPLATGFNVYATGLPATNGGSAVVGAIIRVVKSSSGIITFGITRGDSTDTDAINTGASGSPWQQEYYIGVDGSQQIRMSFNATTNVTVYCLGGFTANEAVFFQNKKTYASSGSGYQLVTVPAGDYGADTPQALILNQCVKGIYSARQPGSTDTWWVDGGATNFGAIIGVALNAGAYQISWLPTGAAIPVNPVGYIKAGLTWKMNATTVTPVSTGSYVDVTGGGLAASTTAACYMFDGTAADESGGIAASTSPSPDLFSRGNINHLFYAIGFPDGAHKIYAKISAATNVVRQMGTFATLSVTPPTITNAVGASYQGSCVITGTGFTTGVVTVTMGGVAQSIVINSATQITIASLARTDGSNQCGYGMQNLIATSTTNGASNSFAIAFGPQTGGQYVVLGILDPTAALRVTAVPDYQPGDIMAGFSAVGSGSFQLFSDGSFGYDLGVTAFSVEIFSNSLQQWGTAGVQTTQLVPLITVAPLAQSIPQGQTATFTVTAVGTPTLTYQWFLNGVSIGGATASSFTTAVQGTPGVFTYSVTVSNSAGASPSVSAALTVVAPVIPPPTDLTPPGNTKSQQLILEEGQGALLSLAIFNPVGTLLLLPADPIGQVYRFFRVPAQGRIMEILMMNDANPTGSSYSVGLYLPNGGGVVVPGADSILVPNNPSLDSARVTWTRLYSNPPGTVAKRVWEVLGLAADPSLPTQDQLYDVCLTAVQPGTAGGNVALWMTYLRDPDRGLIAASGINLGKLS